MIVSLSITNFALIEKLNIDFSEGFSIITGETGAGKSILLGALGLVLGKRADLTSLKNKEEKCIIEAVFSISSYNLESFFSTNDLDYEDLTIIRREILPSGKSRAFINDSPVNLQELQDLSAFLIDIHSQHQTQELSEENFQFQIIDAVANNQDLIFNYTSALKTYKKNKSELANLKIQLQNSVQEQDYFIFLLDELTNVNLIAGEQEELESELEQLTNVELIKENFSKATLYASGEQFSVIQNLKEMKFALQKSAHFSSDYKELFERLVSVSIEFDDISKELDRILERLVNDPERLELVNQRLQAIYSLQRKHAVNSIKELLVIQSNLNTKTASVSELQQSIKVLEAQINQEAIVLDELALQMHNNRMEAIPILTNKWQHILSELGMPNVQFKIELNIVDSYFSNGKDQLQFLFSANKGSDFGLLKKVASGGELSRIMLATKSILAQYSKLPTIIFDEIDTGVSGEIANKMGDIMNQMSTTMQVFAITHLPQIAAKGAWHFKVYKTTINEQTQSELQLLNKEERLIEIAQMLSGSSISESALIHAKALLN
jgi:DNA repair protein RecN (Recombination protein N)